MTAALETTITLDVGALAPVPEQEERRDFGHIYQRGDVYWIRYSVGGKRYRESTGSTSLREAEKALARRQAELGLGHFTAPDVKRTTFEDLAQIIRDDYRVNGRKSTGTLETLLHRLEAAFAGARATTITADRLTRYVAERLDAGAAGSTVRNETNALKRAFRLAKRMGKVAQVPEFPTVRVADPRSGFFEREAFAAVLAQLPVSLQAPIAFAYLTGWRVPSEVLPLTWAQVDFDAGVVRLEVGTTKNKAGRTFPFAVLPDLVQLLEQQRAIVTGLERQLGRVIPHVFVRETGERIRDFYTAWHSACKRAAVTRRGALEVVERPELLGRVPHDFRRTAVRNLVRAGVPERVAMQLTGHKTRAIFDRYNIVNEADLSEGVEKLARFHARGTKGAQSAAGGR
jgi:integrase